ncbi:hypothetical protein [Aeoliella sp. SH292]|uniref:hypothetical protein n=1 Tax=Aeoliella sp. SH292 TaxID=3454464 RepID=UPI003F962A69
MKSLLVGLLLLLVLGTLGYGVYVASRPKVATAKAVFCVESAPSSWNLDGKTQPPTEREIRSFRESMSSMMVTPTVFTAALQNADLQGTFLSEKEKPLEWLEANMVAEFEGDSDLLVLRLEGPEEQANDLRAIVQAVSRAFMDEVVMKARFEGAKGLERLKSSYAEYQIQLREKLTDLATVREESGESAAGSADVRLRELEIESLERTFTLMADRIQQMELDLDRPSQIRILEAAYVTEDE